MEIAVIQKRTRRERCLACEFSDLIHAKGEEFNGPGTVAPEDYFVCERFPGIMTCQMKALLKDPNAECPHPNPVNAVEWKYAELDPAGGCGNNQAATSTSPAIVPASPFPQTQSVPSQPNFRRGHVEAPIVIQRRIK